MLHNFRSVSRNQTEQAVPIPPRGNYQNVHDFLNAFHQHQQQQQQSKVEESVNYNLKASTLPKASEKEGVLALPQATRSTISLAQYYHNKGKVSIKRNLMLLDRVGPLIKSPMHA